MQRCLRDISTLVGSAATWTVVGLLLAAVCLGIAARDVMAEGTVSDRDRQFWSFQPLAIVDVPSVAKSDQVRTAIDQFLLARLHAKNLRFAAEADRATLLRRAQLDLVGLPPTPEEVEAFLTDEQPDAYERLIDRLLASFHFGERWGRHWLDVAGYVDTVGFDTDATNIITSEGKWRYRDWVIRAFNADKPFDHFITEQLAGDELFDWQEAEQFTPEMIDALVATGYLRTARDLTHEDVGVIPQNFFGIVHDTLEIVGTGLLGLTLQCARCHDHKFDPIPQEDYYRLMALLAPAYNPQSWLPVIPYESKVRDRTVADIAPREKVRLEQINAEIDRRQEASKKSLEAIRGPHRARLFEARLASVPEVIRADTRAAIEAQAGSRTEIQKYLAAKLGESLKVTPESVAAELSESERAQVTSIEAEMTADKARRRQWGKIQALYEVGPLPQTHLLVRGNEQTPGNAVGPGFLRVLSSSNSAALASPIAPNAHTSGRRLALARWLTARDSAPSALLARVMVNRVWQQLCGRPLVPSHDNFGAQGVPPTHPELLEWLSREFVDGGWRIKPLIRAIMLSSAYRQASHPSQADDAEWVRAETVDPGNELMWHMRLRRLDSETVRDSMLHASGRLNATAGGPPVMIQARADGMVVVAADKLSNQVDQWRRSVYLVTRRAYNLSLLTVFDQPLVATNCLARDASAVPLQSLVMLNDSFVAEQAELLAQRVERMAANELERQIEMAYQIVLARRPEAAEVEVCVELWKRQAELARQTGATAEAARHQALVQFCHTLLNTSEFLYVE